MKSMQDEGRTRNALECEILCEREITARARLP